MNLRSGFYLAGKLMGDVRAVRNGTVVKRVARRAAGRVTGRLLGRLFR